MNRRVEFLYLQQEDCVKAGGYDMSGALKATERSFFLHGKGDYILPHKPVIRWGGPETEETIGRIMSMPSFLGGEAYREELKARDLLGPVNTSGIKWIPSKPHNPRKYGLPRANALIIIADPETLMPLCVMDGSLVSAMRTGAASGVAVKYLANPGARVMGLVGASVQGITQTHAFKAGAPSLEVCKVYDLSRETCESFVERMTREIPDMTFTIVDSAEEAFRDSDVIATATMAKAPYVKGEWYKKGALHCEISFWDTPPEALKFVDHVVVDDFDAVSGHGVDVSYRAVQDGTIPREKVTDLGQTVVGRLQVRQSPEDIIFFNPIGLGIHDLSEAYRVYTNAKAQGIGLTLPLWDNPILG
jgi:ornithine cyclodeaminase